MGLDALAHEWPHVLLYAFPPLELIIPTLARMRVGGHALILTAPLWPGKYWLAEIVQLLCKSALASAFTQGSPDASARGDLPPSSRANGSVGLARERMNLTIAGLPRNVITTIQGSRASSTLHEYVGKWRAFKEWCVKSGEMAFQSPVSVILTFLQDLLDKGRAFPTVKLYLAAISACHIFGDKTAGQHPIVCQFMKGARRLRPV